MKSIKDRAQTAHTNHCRHDSMNKSRSSTNVGHKESGWGAKERNKKWPCAIKKNTTAGLRDGLTNVGRAAEYGVYIIYLIKLGRASSLLMMNRHSFLSKTLHIRRPTSNESKIKMRDT
jgi:hypothetical protein